MPIPLADLKALCADYDVTVVTNRYVERGQMIVMDPAAFAFDIGLGRLVIAIHPADTPPDHADYD